MSGGSGLTEDPATAKRHNYHATKEPTDTTTSVVERQ